MGKSSQHIKSNRKILSWQVGVLLITILTLLFFWPSLQNGFVAWDDDIYVYNNPLVRNFGLSQLPEIFSSYLWGNYHPLTVISLGIDHALFGLNPKAFHAVNIAWHLACVYLIGILAFHYSQNKYAAWIAAAAFGFHPLHVESVTWISERKDVLYTFFFLLAIWSWEKYKNKPTYSNYALTFLWFVASILSKGMGIVFPAMLIARDLLVNKDIKTINWKEKIPFLVAGLSMGIVALLAQKSVGAIREDVGYSMFDNIIVALYSLTWYLYKGLFPFYLSAFYPYPVKAAGEALPWFYYASPIVLAAITYAVIKFRNKYPELLFGWIWYGAAMVMVIKIVPLSEAMTADRYFYLSSVGLFLSVAIAIGKNMNSWKLYLCIFFIGLWGYSTWNRTQVWKGDETLFSDMIEKYPKLSLAYNNRGKFYYQQGIKDKAVADFIKAAELDKENESAQNNIGFIYLEQKQPLIALTYFKRSVEIHPKFADGYFNLGNTYVQLNEFQTATDCYHQSLEIFKDNPGVWNNLGNAYKSLGKLDSARYSYTQALTLNPQEKNALVGMGEVSEISLNKPEMIQWFEKAIQAGASPSDLFNRIGIAYAKENTFDTAATYFLKATQADPKEVNSWTNLAMAYERMGKIQETVEAYQAAARLGSTGAQNALSRNGIKW